MAIRSITFVKDATYLYLVILKQSFKTNLYETYEVILTIVTQMNLIVLIFKK